MGREGHFGSLMGGGGGGTRTRGGILEKKKARSRVIRQRSAGARPRLVEAVVSINLSGKSGWDSAACAFHKGKGKGARGNGECTCLRAPGGGPMGWCVCKYMCVD